MFSDTLGALWICALLSTIYVLWDYAYGREKTVASVLIMMLMWFFVMNAGIAVDVVVAGVLTATSDEVSVYAGMGMVFISVLFLVNAVFYEAGGLLGIRRK